MKNKKSKKVVTLSDLNANSNTEQSFESFVTRNLVGIKLDEVPTKKKRKNEPEEEYGGILSSSFSSKDF